MYKSDEISDPDEIVVYNPYDDECDDPDGNCGSDPDDLFNSNSNSNHNYNYNDVKSNSNSNSNNVNNSPNTNNLFVYNSKYYENDELDGNYGTY